MGETHKGHQPGQPSRHDLPLPPRLQGKLEHFRERLWSVKIAEGALAGIIGLGLSYLLLFSLDRFFDTPLPLRIALLLAGFAVPALGLPLLWHRWVWRQRTLAEAARFLQRRFPRLGDELLGIIELAHHHPGNTSLVLVEAAMRQVDERAGAKDFSEAVPSHAYHRWLGGALGLLLVAGLLFLLVSDAAQNTLARWITPWKAVERYTFAQIEPLPATLVVPYAEAFPLTPALTGASEWRPPSATIHLPGDTELSSPLAAGGYAFSIPPQKENAALSLRVGDARETIFVEPKTRPELTALEAVIRLPDYLRYEQDPVIPVRGGTLSVVTGASATIRGTTSRTLAGASADGETAAVDGAGFSTEPIPVSEPLTRTFTWNDIHGLEAKSPLQLKIHPVPDEAPDLFAHQVGSKRVYLEDEVVTFDLTANDDFGLREVGLEWRALDGETTAPSPLLGEKPVVAGDPEKTSVQARGTFSAKREGIAPQSLQVRAFATDFLPDRPRTYSPTFVVHILSPQDHAKWLTEEFAKWFRTAREVYEREQQLHEGNLALRRLDSDDLDQPENRRRLQEQSSAESSNARRLDALTRAGRGLVEEAVKNVEFDAERLESWAAMMKALDGIARERMPSVADLLQQASRAPGAPSDPAAEAEPESTGEDAPATPVEEKVDEALAEQKELLDEFARVTDELREILSSLEASTFVKRLKAASRKQTEIAASLHQTLPDSFGLSRHRLTQQTRALAAETARTQEEQSRAIHHIQTDLEAYYQRKQEPIYKNVLDQMKDRSVVSQIRTMGQESLLNLGGRSIAASEFWADTLDRWAEELIAAASGEPQQQQQGDSKSLPPELVLRIMKALHDEMQLREETREMEGTRPAFAPDVYASKVRPLEYTQSDIRQRIDEVVTDIQALPGGARTFGKEIQLLSLVSDVMRQSRAVLARPDTGAEAIAAQTEAIELLLQSKRNQSGSGGGGSGSGNSGASSSGGGSHLSDIGPDGEAGPVGTETGSNAATTTGKAGRELPEEFRRGLDHYFNQLESN
ncbi:MAG: hypothetical protein GXX91_02745 [Verrucomicrobiaceae bacterium]|nr:hypothetical protein [Verrucomicrobiaceae bacterium]